MFTRGGSAACDGCGGGGGGGGVGVGVGVGVVVGAPDCCDAAACVARALSRSTFRQSRTGGVGFVVTGPFGTLTYAGTGSFGLYGFVDDTSFSLG